MGLIKTRPTQYGIDTTYHKVALTNIDWHGGRARVEVLSFLNKQARLEGACPMDFYALEVSGDQFVFTYDENVVQKAYEMIKAKEEFDGAEDDLSD